MGARASRISDKGADKKQAKEQDGTPVAERKQSDRRAILPTPPGGPSRPSQEKSDGGAALHPPFGQTRVSIGIVGGMSSTG